MFALHLLVTTAADAHSHAAAAVDPPGGDFALVLIVDELEHPMALDAVGALLGKRRVGLLVDGRGCVAKGLGCVVFAGLAPGGLGLGLGRRLGERRGLTFGPALELRDKFFEAIVSLAHLAQLPFKLGDASIALEAAEANRRIRFERPVIPALIDVGPKRTGTLNSYPRSCSLVCCVIASRNASP